MPTGFSMLAARCYLSPKVTHQYKNSCKGREELGVGGRGRSVPCYEHREQRRHKPAPGIWSVTWPSAYENTFRQHLVRHSEVVRTTGNHRQPSTFRCSSEEFPRTSREILRMVITCKEIQDDTSAAEETDMQSR